MSDGEIDRRIAEREAADRRYNDALTAVDRALPRPEVAAPAPVALALDAASVRARAAILPDSPPRGRGWRGRLAAFVWRIVGPVFTRQQALNEVLAEQASRTEAVLRDLAHAVEQARSAHARELQVAATFHSVLAQYLQQITPFIDTKLRVIDASLEELRMTAASAQRSAVAARRALERMAAGQLASGTAADMRQLDASGPPRVPPGAGACGAAYIGFEDLFRGSVDEVRERQVDYARRFAGASDVVDIGCGRGELLELLRDHGVSARGVDVNADMVDVCRARGLDAHHADALSYLQAQPDQSLGGLIATQVVEHLEPDYLVRLIEAAHARLRPGATIILETINAACWVAFFENYIRDITHVRPLHPDTLKFLVVAAGFEHVDVHFRSPIAESGRLQYTSERGVPPALLDAVTTMNANVQRLNERLFTYLDYAVIGRRGA